MITISVGQALLILMGKYKDDLPMFENIKKLYLRGAATQEDLSAIERLIAQSSNSELNDYSISLDVAVMNEDTTRRYFESHLAYETLKESVDELSMGSLLDFCLESINLCEESHLYEEDIMDLHAVLAGNIEGHQYSDTLKKIIGGETFKDFKVSEQYKINLLVMSSYITTSVCYYKRGLPLSIYGKVYFKESDRGRIEKLHQRHVKSSYYGIMKSTMPCPRNDIIINEKPFSFVRPPERYTADEDALWVIENSAQLVHPFVTSISGTMLTQLRVFKYLSLSDAFPFNNDKIFLLYIKNFISALLFNLGGHGLQEFLGPLALPKVQEAFSHLESFKHITIQKIFYENNKKAFEKALADTLVFSDILLKKKKLMQSILELKQSNHLKSHHDVSPSRVVIKPEVKQRTTKEVLKWEDEVLFTWAPGKVNIIPNMPRKYSQMIFFKAKSMLKPYIKKTKTHHQTKPVNEAVTADIQTEARIFKVINFFRSWCKASKIPESTVVEKLKINPSP